MPLLTVSTAVMTVLSLQGWYTFPMSHDHPVSPAVRGHGIALHTSVVCARRSLQGFSTISTNVCVPSKVSPIETGITSPLERPPLEPSGSKTILFTTPPQGSTHSPSCLARTNWVPLHTTPGRTHNLAHGCTVFMGGRSTNRSL